MSRKPSATPDLMRVFVTRTIPHQPAVKVSADKMRNEQQIRLCRHRVGSDVFLITLNRDVTTELFNRIGDTIIELMAFPAEDAQQITSTSASYRFAAYQPGSVQNRTRNLPCYESLQGKNANGRPIWPAEDCFKLKTGI